MSANNIKETVALILNIPNHLAPHWDVIDTYPKENPKLALAHYNDTFDHYARAQEPLRFIRGTVVDLTTGAVVADSYGYTQTLPCDEPLEIRENTNELVIRTELATYLNSEESAPNEAAKLSFGERHFDFNQTRLFLGQEGAMIRIFKWDGKVFFSTQKRIDAVDSAWGMRPAFSKIYNDLGGPDPESLFGDEEYSPYCHMFLIADNRIRLATSTQDNRVIYLGVMTVWDEAKYAYVEDGGNELTVGLDADVDQFSTDQPGQAYFLSEDTEVGPYFYYQDFPLIIPQFGKDDSPFSPELNRAFIEQPRISPFMANKFMFPGTFAAPFPEDTEYPAKENEIIVDYAYNPNYQTSLVREIFFNGYRGKIDERMAGGDFVMLYTQDDSGRTVVYRLEPSAFRYRVEITNNDPNFYHRFVTEMVNFTKAEPHELTEKYPQFLGQDGKPLNLTTPMNRQVYWWSMFHTSVAPAYKDEVDGFFEAYKNDLQMVANFILNVYPKMRDEEELKRINENTQKRFTNLREISHTHSRGEKTSPFGVIKNLLYRETGPSFYKMISSIKNVYKYREAQKAERAKGQGNQQANKQGKVQTN